MKNQVLSISQMQELIELGIDTSKASMIWNPYEFKNKIGHELKVYDDDIHRIVDKLGKLSGGLAAFNFVPTFTLQDILGMLPREIEEHNFVLESNYDEWDMYYFLSVPDKEVHTIGNIVGDSLLEAAFNMLKWCKQNNYI